MREEEEESTWKEDKKTVLEFERKIDKFKDTKT